MAKQIGSLIAIKKYMEADIHSSLDAEERKVQTRDLTEFKGSMPEEELRALALEAIGYLNEAGEDLELK